MATGTGYKYSEDSAYVDIHGNDIRVFVCEKTGRILVPIDELKNSGFRIYQKNQYDRLLIDESQFIEEFYMHLLECAKTYMLKKQISFTDQDIIENINKAKRRLTEGMVSGDATSSTPNHVSENNRIEKNGTSFKEPCTFKNSFVSQSSENSDDKKRSTNLKINWNRENGFQKGDQSKVNGFNLRRPRNLNFNEKSSSPQQQQQQQYGDDDADNEIRTVQLNKPEHEVVMTHYDPEIPGIMWVQDLANLDTILEINKKIKEEVPSAIRLHRYELNTVYLGQQEDEWYRCKTVKFKPLTVFYLDYGNVDVVNVNGLKEVSEKLALIPAQAVKVKFDPSTYTPKDSDCLTLKVKGKTGKRTFVVDVIPKGADAESVAPPQKKMLTPVKLPTFPTYFDKPRPLCELAHGQRVMIINEVDGRLALRTKECYAKLKQIEQAIEDAPCENVDSVQKGQLVLCVKDDKKLRGQVTKVERASVELQLLDFCEIIKVKVSEIRHITNILSIEPTTYIMSPTVRGSNELCDVKQKYIEQLVATKAKGTVILEGADFDLELIDGLLSNKLRNLEGSSARLMMTEMTKYQPSLGHGVYMLSVLKNNTVTILPKDEVESHCAELVITNMKDTNPYTPILGEVCLGLYQGSWGRCCVTKVMSSRFEVTFIDFGNVEILNSEQLRKIKKDSVYLQALGVPCCFVGLPIEKNALQLLEKYFIDGEYYKVNVKRFDARNGRFEIEVPELYQKMTEKI